MKTVVYRVSTATVSQAMLIAFLALLIEDNREFRWSATNVYVRVPNETKARRSFEIRCLQFSTQFEKLDDDQLDDDQL